MQTEMCCHIPGVAVLVQILWLSDNPLGLESGYADHVARLLPQVLKLDNVCESPRSCACTVHMLLHVPCMCCTCTMHVLLHVLLHVLCMCCCMCGACVVPMHVLCAHVHVARH